jgi:hypothetical protein
MSTFAKPQSRQQQSSAQAKSSAQVKSPSPERSAESRRASDDEIRALAYQKWQEAGSPTGDGAEFWLAAEIEILRRQKPR